MSFVSCRRTTDRSKRDFSLVVIKDLLEEIYGGTGYPAGSPYATGVPHLQVVV